MHTITYRYTSSGTHSVSDDVAQYMQMLSAAMCTQGEADPALWVQNVENTGPLVSLWVREWSQKGGNVPFLDAATPDRSTQEEDKARACRFFVASEGHCVMLGDPSYLPATPEQHRELRHTATTWDIPEEVALTLLQLEESSRSYVYYAMEAGLVSRDAVQRCVIVPDLYDFDVMLPLLKASGRRVRGYLDSPDWRALAQAHGVRTTQSSAPQENLNDKHQARDVLHQLCIQAELSEPYPYPRAYVAASETLSIDAVKGVMEYYGDSPPRYADNSLCVLFAQQTISSGGDGNYPVFRSEDGHYRVRSTPCRDLAEVVRYLNTLEGDVELCPYLDVLASPSIGGCTTSEGTSVIAPIEAVLHGETRSHAGFYLRAEKSYPENPLVARFLTQELSEGGQLRRLLGEFGRYLWECEYSGYWSLDLILFRDPHGQLRLTPGEVNLRTTGTCNAQMVAVNHPRLRERWQAGKLSIHQDDWVPIPDELYERTGGDALRVMQQGEAAMLMSQSDTGALLVVPPTSPGQLNIDGDTRSMHTLVHYS